MAEQESYGLRRIKSRRVRCSEQFTCGMSVLIFNKNYNILQDTDAQKITSIEDSLRYVGLEYKVEQDEK